MRLYKRCLQKNDKSKHRVPYFRGYHMATADCKSAPVSSLFKASVQKKKRRKIHVLICPCDGLPVRPPLSQLRAVIRLHSAPVATSEAAGGEAGTELREENPGLLKRMSAPALIHSDKRRPDGSR